MEIAFQWVWLLLCLGSHYSKEIKLKLRVERESIEQTRGEIEKEEKIAEPARGKREVGRKNKPANSVSDVAGTMIKDYVYTPTYEQVEAMNEQAMEDYCDSLNERFNCGYV
ncbi:hypothetical protein NE237_020773 [Protea cynaroides]|uniref:Uncharacterized protein n=1 Tax=Protea cynaroides TaxID=273540 RepID=A0A9Q0H9V5_9MAGN|nr:hypothetical protein NE237_020773 [Protea cynaroides]